MRHRNGREVVVVSRAAFDAMQPTVKDVLLRGGPIADDDSELDDILARNRAEGITLMGRLPKTTK